MESGEEGAAVISDIIACNKMYTEKRSAGSIEALRKDLVLGQI